MEGTRIFLVDDQAAVVERLCQALSGEFSVVGTAGSGEELLSQALQLRPDVIVLDVSMPGMSGIEAAERVKALLPDVKVVMLSMHSDPLYVSEALKAGASAYVLKTRGVDELALAIREVRSNNIFLTPALRNED